MRFERGSLGLLHGCTPHVEQDGAWFFCFHTKADAEAYKCAPVVIEIDEISVPDLDDKQAVKAQSVLKRAFAEHGITATFDY